MSVKIDHLTIDRRTRAFVLRVKGRMLRYPFARLRLKPGRSEKIVEAYVDPEIGREGFTYRLSSGKEDTVPVDAVLDYNRDPGYLRRMLLYRLTVLARKALARSALSKRELTRRLQTSPAQIYRLLDTTNNRKSLDEMVRLLACLHVDLDVVARRAA